MKTEKSSLAVGVFLSLNTVKLSTVRLSSNSLVTYVPQSDW